MPRTATSTARTTSWWPPLLPASPRGSTTPWGAPWPTLAAARPSRALRLLDRAIGTRPQDPRLHLLRGRYRLERHQCEKALDDFETATRYDPRNALAFASVGLARLCTGDSEGAAASFHRSLAIDPNQPEIRRALGQIGG